MNRLEKCELAIEQGFTYDSITGKVYGKLGKVLNGKSNKGYLIMKLYKDKKQYELKQHQFAWYCINKEVVDCLDHINGNKSDNKIINLRSITIQQNCFNTKAKGYYWDKTNKKWQSSIRLNGKLIYLGIYNTEEEAREVYLQHKKTLHIY